MTIVNETATAPVQRPEPVRNELEEHFARALADGRLIYQRTAENAWLPPRTEDPLTLSPDWQWAEASGRGRIVSWVTYHIAFHPYWADKLPYQVAIVELDEGPRMIAPIEMGGRTPHVDLPVLIDIRYDDGHWIPVFVPAEDPAPNGASQ